MGGALSLGDIIEFQPSGLTGRIRGLQSYQRTVETLAPGCRAAVNVSGINSGEIRRGDVLAFPGQIQPTLLADAVITQLGDISRPLTHNAEVKIFCGASEALANARLLAEESLAPGARGWLQIRLRQPLPLSRGDRFILRYPSPAETIGGGVIIDAHPGRRRKRFQPDVIAELELRASGTPGERLALAAQSEAPQSAADLQKSLGFADAEMTQAISEAMTTGLIRRLDDQRYWAAQSMTQLLHAAIAELRAYHKATPCGWACRGRNYRAA